MARATPLDDPSRPGRLGSDRVESCRHDVRLESEPLEVGSDQEVAGVTLHQGSCASECRPVVVE